MISTYAFYGKINPIELLFDLKKFLQLGYILGKEVPYGTKDSVRPDFVIGDKAAFEVKNYDVAKNSDGLVREVVRQVKARAIHLPEGMKQRVMIDVRGQSVSDSTGKIV